MQICPKLVWLEIFYAISGSDELSTAFSDMVNNDVIRNKLESDDFVAIKVQSDSEAYIQFAQICKVSAHHFYIDYQIE